MFALALWDRQQRVLKNPPDLECADVAGLVAPLVVLMFVFSKLLPLLFLPLGFAFLLLIFGAARGRRWPGTAALALLWIFATPLVAEALWRWLEWPLKRRTAAVVLQKERPSAVVVLGSGRHPAPGPARASEWIDADRFFAGLKAHSNLQRKGKASLLIFTGGWWPTQPHLPPEGDVLRHYAIDLGVPADEVLSTSKVRNTADEAKEVSRLLPNGSKVMIVTSAFHMHRAQRLFERQGLTVLPFPVDFQASGTWAGHPLSNPLNYLPTAHALSSSSRALREAMGRTIYRAW